MPAPLPSLRALDDKRTSLVAANAALLRLPGWGMDGVHSNDAGSEAKILIPFCQLETKRLLLRQLREDDLPHSVKMLDNKRLVEYMNGIPHPYTMDDANWYLNDRRQKTQKGEVCLWAICLRDSNLAPGTSTYIGNIEVNDIDTENSRGNVGYWIAESQWNNGYASEALAAVFTYVFGNTSIHKLTAYYTTKNVGSGKVMEKCGMKREGLLKQHEKRHGAFLDVALYGILRSEWAARQNQAKGKY